MIDNIRTQMRKGLLELSVLLILSHQRAYPSDLLRTLRQGGITVVEGTLYALLTRLHKEGALDYEWEESTIGPPRKYYTLTPQGHHLLSLLRQEWERISASINTFI